MKFIDEAIVTTIAGKGGDGCLSFRREKYIPLGGPNGGNGGNGGNVILQGDLQLNTLINFRYTRILKAESGRHGEGSDKSGASGKHQIFKVPLGTVIYGKTKEATDYILLGDIVADQQQFIVANGGKGGLGNAHFKSSTNRAPRRITKGTLGEEIIIKLELRILADVGLLGMPNAGKSTLISCVSAARPKIAEYPFTTLKPNLAIVKLDLASNFVIADIPGLIAGASLGKGLGFSFLKHLQRTKLLLHLVDASSNNAENIIQNIQHIHQELINFDIKLFDKVQYIVLTKIDTINDNSILELKNKLQAKFTKLKIYAISAIANKNLMPLLWDIYISL